MPIYVLKCTNCGYTTEYFAHSYKSLKKECEKCGGGMEQVFAPFNFKINGYSYKNNYEKEKK